MFNMDIENAVWILNNKIGMRYDESIAIPKMSFPLNRFYGINFLLIHNLTYKEDQKG